MDRPGLTQLLRDVEVGRIDVIVAYKVDRLTRSLADFAKMVDLFDKAGASFVSVTQAFNTTSSMGRLTLNVLLSFAQFEREVTAERIRDKVAASKRKGMWMGGAVPMGYDVKDRALVVNQDEAAAIRIILAEYLSAGSVRELSKRLNKRGVISKRRTNRYGRTTGGKALSRGALYNILRNPIYIGKTRHKEDLYDGLHEAIIDEATWQRVQAQLADHGGKEINAPRRSAKRFLDGLLFDKMGRAMRTTYACKSVRRDGTTQTKRYWYYTSKVAGAEHKNNIERLPAKETERLVLDSLKEQLGDKTWLADQIGSADVDEALIADILRAAQASLERSAAGQAAACTASLTSLIERIDVQRDRLRIRVNLHEMLGPDVSCGPIAPTTDVPFHKRQNGRAKPIVIAPLNARQPDADLVALVADALRWAAELLQGKTTTIRQIEVREGLRRGSVSRILPLAWLAPDISTAILNGRQSPDLTAKTLRNLPELPTDWQEQRRILGFRQL